MSGGLPETTLHDYSDLPQRQPDRVSLSSRHGRKPAEMFVYATASIDSGVSFMVVRRNSRRSLRSKRRPRWTVARLSHITRSPTSHLCVVYALTLRGVLEQVGQ